MPLDVLTSIVGPLSTILVPTNLALPQVGGVVLQNLGLSQPEEDVLLSFGRRSQPARHLFQRRGSANTSLYGLSFCLLTLGALVHPHNLSQDDRKEAARASACAGTGQSAERSDGGGAEKARLSETADYFTLLGVPAGASIEEVEAAYARERAAIAPAGLPQRSRATMERELRQIAMVLDEAYAVLADPVLRACYAPTAKRLPGSSPGTRGTTSAASSSSTSGSVASPRKLALYPFDKCALCRSKQKSRALWIGLAIGDALFDKLGTAGAQSSGSCACLGSSCGPIIRRSGTRSRRMMGTSAAGLCNR